MAQDSIFHGPCTTGQIAAAMVQCKQAGMHAQPLIFSIGEQRTVLPAKPATQAVEPAPAANRRTRGR